MLKPTYPSSPNRPPQAGFYLTREDGARCFRTFYGVHAAKRFLDLNINGQSYRWLGEEEIVLENGIRIKGEGYIHLDDIITYKLKGEEAEFEFTEPDLSEYRRFALITQPSSPGNERSPDNTPETKPKKEKKTKTPRPSADGQTSIAEIAESIGMTPGEARKILRATNTPKPDGGWSWSDPAPIARLLKENKR